MASFGANPHGRTKGVDECRGIVVTGETHKGESSRGPLIYGQSKSARRQTIRTHKDDEMEGGHVEDMVIPVLRSRIKVTFSTPDRRSPSTSSFMICRYALFKAMEQPRQTRPSAVGSSHTHLSFQQNCPIRQSKERKSKRKK